MSNLLRAQLRRTFRGRLFWVELAVAAVLALTILLNGYFGTNLTNAYVFKLVARMFGYAPLMGVFVGLFTAHLWGATTSSAPCAIPSSAATAVGRCMGASCAVPVWLGWRSPACGCC